MLRPATTRVLLDLGDLFSKGLVLGAGMRRRLRFPSAVATRLLAPDDAGVTALNLGEPVLRPEGFDVSRHPRERSYPGGGEFLRRVSGRAAEGALYAGWLAAAYGADRRFLGQHADPALIGALTRKALLLARVRRDPVEVVFVLDAAPKARLIAEQARAREPVEMIVARHREAGAREVRLEVRARVLDAPACAAAGARGPGARMAGRLLILDVGYWRTKLAVVSPEGCEWQAEHSLGVVDCVRRLLRDGQSAGLVADELAVALALEPGGDAVGLTREPAWRRARPILDDALRVLADETARLGRQALVEQAQRTAEPCRGLAVIGGGAPLVGRAVTARLVCAGLGLQRFRVARDPDVVLVEGAARLVARGLAGRAASA